MKYYLDTNTCIYYLKGIHLSVAGRLLSHHPHDIRIPSVVKAKLLYGAERSERREENLQKIRQFLLPFEVAAFGADEAERYAAIRATLEKDGTPIGPNDLIIAAITIESDGTLITNNEREFRRIPQLKVENWVE